MLTEQGKATMGSGTTPWVSAVIIGDKSKGRLRESTVSTKFTFVVADILN